VQHPPKWHICGISAGGETFCTVFAYLCVPAGHTLQLWGRPVLTVGECCVLACRVLIALPVKQALKS